ncbi:MAG: HlyC/CorC family transporter [Bacillota bacterium]|nr:MAG: HlyC/CorC family transporter [Bacillota bacterium]
MPEGTVPLLLAIIVLLLLSGFFSSMETAYSCANKLKLKTMSANGNARAEKTLRLAEKYDALLSTILVGNNIVNITMTTLSGIFFAILITNQATAATVSTVAATVAVLIIGEITPKMIANVYPEKFAMAGYPVLIFFKVILYPVNMIFTGWKWLLAKAFKLKNDSIVTEDEIMTMVEEAQSGGTLKQEETRLIRSVIEFDDLEVVDILIPRVNITAVELGTSFDKIKDIFDEEGYSRIPVYKGSIDTVVGILHEKDFFQAYLKGKKDISPFLQSVVYTTEHIKISALLKQLQKKKAHMAVVLDEYGGTSGIVTLEDILEELVGEIWDEHDEETTWCRPLDDNTMLIDAKASLLDFLELYEIDADEYDNYDAITVSGWVIEQLGGIPAVGREFRYNHLDIEVTKSTVKKVLEIKVTKLPPEKAETEKKNDKKLLHLFDKDDKDAKENNDAD